ncbi:uncharacterized protein EI90DRAFT_3293650 [Cantharellus anzutake]|uniref:uncharacterized protein n=1 Tax=Cantharellus anzutake TaxID=1750568 RepID=UPI0019075F28|nr:uncharacterized protein EI90DRAFT_3293650 [Cantharellus anzutake]KAF8316469.1 hypothetical protein EI90DRAFT_3293650 [Cantharellus anzutake]
MRFWIAFVAIALVPVVAADFYYGYAWCDPPSGPGTLETHAIILPANQNNCPTATGWWSQYYKQQSKSVWNWTIAAQLCGATVTVAIGNFAEVQPFWNSSDGGSGECSHWLPGSPDGTQVMRCSKEWRPWGTVRCIYVARGICDSYLCK